MDLKLANHVIKKDDPGVTQFVLSSILQQADLDQVMELKNFYFQTDFSQLTIING